MFIAFTGEETGLLGSEHYVKHSTVAMDQIVAMLNMDMIGGLKGGKLQVFGADSAVEFSALVTAGKGEAGFGWKANGGAWGAQAAPARRPPRGTPVCRMEKLRGRRRGDDTAVSTWALAGLPGP